MARYTPGDRLPPLSPPKERRKAGFFSCNPLGRKGSGEMKIGKNAGITGNSPGKRRKGRVSLKFPVIPALFLILIPSDPHQRNGSAGKIPAFPHPYIPHTPPPTLGSVPPNRPNSRNRLRRSHSHGIHPAYPFTGASGQTAASVAGARELFPQIHCAAVDLGK